MSHPEPGVVWVLITHGERGVTAQVYSTPEVMEPDLRTELDQAFAGDDEVDPLDPARSWDDLLALCEESGWASGGAIDVTVQEQTILTQEVLDRYEAERAEAQRRITEGDN